MGAVAPFVLLWRNTPAGVVYLDACLGLWQGRRWSSRLSLAILAATLLVCAAFGLHVGQRGAFEMRTASAMALLSKVWGGNSVVARQAFSGR